MRDGKSDGQVRGAAKAALREGPLAGQLLQLSDTLRDKVLPVFAPFSVLLSFPPNLLWLKCMYELSNGCQGAALARSNH